MDLGLKGKRALVLGSSAGIGKAIAGKLVREGAKVALCSRNRERLLAAQIETGASYVVVGDLSKPQSGRRVVEAAAGQLGGLDILITNTGGPPGGTFERISPETWDKAYQNLFRSAVDSIQAAIPLMKAGKWGRVVLLTSIAAKEPVPNLIVSSALRAGILGLTNALSKELAADGITVNSVLPGYTRTERLLELGLDLTTLERQIPARRLAQPEELGSLVAFLCSEDAGYITGQAIACDGGALHGV